MSEATMGRTVGGFALGAALFGAVDGYLAGGAFWSADAHVTGAAAGALIGGMIGVGLALLAWKPRPQDVHPSAAHGHPANYMMIWGVLFVLTAIEVSAAFELPLSKLTVIGILVVLAVWKAVLVALYYMHLRFEPRRLWVLAMSPLPLAVILVMTVLYEGWR